MKPISEDVPGVSGTAQDFQLKKAIYNEY